MSVKILSRRSNYLERAIVFEVDGEIKSVSAPRDAKSFDDLLKQIETEYGGGDAPGKGTSPKPQKEPAAEPSEGVVEVVAEVVTEPTDAPAEPETTAPTTAKKTSSKKKAKG